jgi:hypothetical protein
MSDTDTDTAAAQRAERVEEASDRMRDLMESLDKIGHETGITRTEWLADVRKNLAGLVERYADWTLDSEGFADEPPYVDPTPWECQPCGYRGDTQESIATTIYHEGRPFFNPRTTRPE